MGYYRLIEKQSDMKETFIVTIVGDSNDGDYVTVTEHYDKEGFEEVLPALIDLQENYSDNHRLEDYPNDMDLSIPYNGWDGYCHSLEELRIEYVDADGKIFDVEIFE